MRLRESAYYKLIIAIMSPVYLVWGAPNVSIYMGTAVGYGIVFIMLLWVVADRIVTIFKKN